MVHNFWYFWLFWVFKDFFLINMITILMMSAKLATLGLLKIKVFWNNAYDVIISVHDVTNKILSRDSNCTVHMVMWPKIGNSRVWPENPLFLRGGLGSSSIINSRLALGMILKFYTGVAKRLKLKVRSFLRLNPKILRL